jgi:hypothetical protein
MRGNVFPRVPRILVFKFCLVLVTSVIIANTLVINFVIQFPSQHYSITVAALNATTCLATTSIRFPWHTRSNIVIPHIRNFVLVYR